jgi:hypothetical protein
MTSKLIISFLLLEAIYNFLIYRSNINSEDIMILYIFKGPTLFYLVPFEALDSPVHFPDKDYYRELSCCPLLSSYCYSRCQSVVKAMMLMLMVALLENC